MSTFVCLTEDNDWEGETWQFWLQVERNEEALRELFELLAKFELDSYHLDLGERVSEEEVDTLVKFADEGYMDSDIKVTGKMSVPHFDNGHVLACNLYKGGIESWFKEV